MSKMHKNLILDHLYFSASPDQFEELKQFFLQFECASHQHVKADDDSWEGLYIFTRSQFYLEILRARRPDCIGLCQKPLYPLVQDARHIIQDFPDLPWKTFERSMKGKKWFAALSCDNYLDLSTPFNTWVMHYFQRDTEIPASFPKYELATFFEVEAVADPKLLDHILLNSRWFNAKRTVSDNEIIFDFQTYYSDPMRLRIHLAEGRAGIQFRSLKFRMTDLSPMQVIETLNMKHFSIKQNQECYELLANEVR